MCTYIDAALPRDADLDAVSAAIARLNLGSGTEPGHPGGDPMIVSVLPQKYCHCGTVLGSVNRPHTPDDAAFERQLEQHRKRGWSEARIRRWLEEKHRVQRRSEREYREGRDRSRTDYRANTWCDFLKEVLTTGATSRIGLRVGEPDQKGREKPISRQVTVRLDELDERTLEEMDEDVLYWFTQ
jgi:hypothetical protein